MSLHHLLSNNGIVVLTNNPEREQGGPIKITQKPYAGEISHMDFYQADDQRWLLQLDFFGFPKRFDVDEPERIAQELMAFIDTRYGEVLPSHSISYSRERDWVKMGNKVVYRGVRSYESFFLYNGYAYKLLRVNGDVTIRRLYRLAMSPEPSYMGEFYASHRFNKPSFATSVLDTRVNKPDHANKWWRFFARSVDMHYPQTTEVFGCSWPEILNPFVPKTV